MIFCVCEPREKQQKNHDSPNSYTVVESLGLNLLWPQKILVVQRKSTEPWTTTTIYKINVKKMCKERWNLHVWSLILTQRPLPKWFLDTKEYFWRYNINFDEMWWLMIDWLNLPEAEVIFVIIMIRKNLHISLPSYVQKWAR